MLSRPRASQFFTAEALTNCIREAKKHPFQTYRYKLTHKFEETKLQQTRDPRSPLRVWEEAIEVWLLRYW